MEMIVKGPILTLIFVVIVVTISLVKDVDAPEKKVEIPPVEEEVETKFGTNFVHPFEWQEIEYNEWRTRK